MKKYTVWCIALVLLVTLPLLAACTGGEVPSTPRSTITPTPTTTTPKSTPTATATSTPTATVTAPVPTTTTPAETETPTTTPAPTATETVTPTEEPDGDGGIPAIPHTIDGRGACLLCHASGVGGADIVPADHEGRTDDSCTMCHQPL